MRRVTVTIPDSLVESFDRAVELHSGNASKFILSALEQRITETVNDPDTKDLYMVSGPEGLRVLSRTYSSQLCIRGQEIGEDHVIEPGQLFSWFKFGRDTQDPDWVKNGKLCKNCTEVARAMFERGEKYF